MVNFIKKKCPGCGVFSEFRRHCANPKCNWWWCVLCKQAVIIRK